jgi:hypothetical protein
MSSQASGANISANWRMLEKAGIPAVPVLTDAFDSTAKEMAELWGVPDFRFVMMPHPLASLTPPDVELRSRSNSRMLETIRSPITTCS